MRGTPTIRLVDGKGVVIRVWTEPRTDQMGFLPPWQGQGACGGRDPWAYYLVLLSSKWLDQVVSEVAVQLLDTHLQIKSVAVPGAPSQRARACIANAVETGLR